MSGSRSDVASRHARAAHPDEETRYQAVGELDGGDPSDRAVLLGALADASWRVRSAAAERISAAPDPAAPVPGLIEILANGPSVGARDAAASALARLGAPAVAALVERLGAPDPDMRQATAGVLGAIADGRAVAPLTARLADPDPNVRAAAAEALGKIGGAASVASLRAAVDSDDATLRLTALEALGALGASLPTARIEQLLADRALRRPLYRLLGASDDPAALAIVARGLSDAGRVGRDGALGALGQQRARRGSAVELAPALEGARAAAARDPGLVDAWAAALASEEPFVVIGSLTALGAAGGARHAGSMVRLAEDERYRSLVEESLEAFPPGPELRAALADTLPGLGQLARITALAALARLGSPASFESLVREASDRESYVQAEAIDALGRLRDARGVPPLAGLLGSEDPATSALACTSLVRIGQSGAAGRRAVLAAVRDRAEASPTAAAYRVLGAVGEEQDVVGVVAGLRAEAPADRAAAASAVGALAHRGVLAARAVPGFAAALSDPVPAVRAAAARALAEAVRAWRAAGAAAAGPCADGERALHAALRDADPAVRAAAAEALGACGRADDAGELAVLVRDPGMPPPVVLAALRALQELGGVPAAVLACALVHPDPEVIKEAVVAAAHVPGVDGERILLEAAASARWDVRRAAARALAARNDPALRAEAERLAAREADPLVARAFAEAARALGSR